MIVKFELTEDDVESVCRVLSDAADFSRDMARDEEDDEELEAFTEDASDFRRIAGYLATVLYIAATRAFKQTPSLN